MPPINFSHYFLSPSHGVSDCSDRGGNHPDTIMLSQFSSGENCRHDSDDTFAALVHPRDSISFAFVSPSELCYIFLTDMSKQIVAVGCYVPDPDIESVPFKSNRSILDADIVIFCPTLKDYVTDSTYAGQPVISQSDSVELKRHTDHWKSELTIALEHSKTVFLFLEEIGDCHIHSGQQEISGTGRSRRVSNIVYSYGPYSSVPLDGLVGRFTQATAVA